ARSSHCFLRSATSLAASRILLIVRSGSLWRLIARSRWSASSSDSRTSRGLPGAIEAALTRGGLLLGILDRRALLVLVLAAHLDDLQLDAAARGLPAGLGVFHLVLADRRDLGHGDEVNHVADSRHLAL